MKAETEQFLTEQGVFNNVTNVAMTRNKLAELLEKYKSNQSRQADVMRSPPLEGLPENKPIYKDSGLWQMRSDDMEGVIIQQGVNESEDDFLKRCRDFHAEEMNQLLSNDGGGAA